MYICTMRETAVEREREREKEEQNSAWSGEMIIFEIEARDARHRFQIETFCLRE